MTGVLSTIGILLHQFPEGIVTFVLLQRHGFDRRRATACAFVAARISTPLGASVVYPSSNVVAFPRHRSQCIPHALLTNCI